MNATRLLAGFTMAEADVCVPQSVKRIWKMKSMGEKFIVQAQAGWIDVELEDGTTQRIHRAEHFKCEDGTLKTVEEALEHGAKLPINAVRVTASPSGLIWR